MHCSFNLSHAGLADATVVASPLEMTECGPRAPWHRFRAFSSSSELCLALVREQVAFRAPNPGPMSYSAHSTQCDLWASASLQLGAGRSEVLPSRSRKVLICTVCGLIQHSPTILLRGNGSINVQNASGHQCRLYYLLHHGTTNNVGWMYQLPVRHVWRYVKADFLNIIVFFFIVTMYDHNDQ